MIVCPVCEHPQSSGAECELCGHRLAGGEASAPPVPLVEGLEPTRLEPVDAQEERLPDLEVTRHLPVPLAPPDALEALDLEPTGASPVDVAAEALPDLERTAAELPGDGPTPLATVTICRYCRTPAGPGERICSRCGMRLPVEAVPGTAAPTEEGPRLCSCGTPVRGSRCAACGARLPDA
ncbi:MAG TPA: hypothetical protein VML50_11530 [Anaeromyxobacter sp.]|nr:hypothetical protein [Anaeromyxobacter sp.]